MSKAVSKKKSKTKSGVSVVILSLLTVIILAVGVLSFVSFEIKGTIYDYNAVINKIKLGTDIEGSAYSILEPEIDDESGDITSQVDQSVKTLQKRLSIKGYGQGSVTKLDNNRIKLQIPIVSDTESALKSLASTGNIEFRIEEDGESLVDGLNIKKAQAGYTVNDAQTAYVPVVSITFDKQGTKDFASATEQALSGSKNIYIYLDGEKISTATVSAKISNGKVSIKNDNWSIEQAKNMADIMSSGKLAIEFTQTESALMSSALGYKALTKTLIAGGIAVFLIIAGLAVCYKGLGAVAAYTLIINILTVFLTLTFSSLQLTLGGIAAIILSFSMTAGLLCVIFDRIKKEYADGRIPAAAIRYGFNKTLRAVIDVLLVSVIAAVCVYFIGTSAAKGFALIFIVCAVISGLMVELVARWVLKLFMPLIKNKEKCLGLVREDQNV